MLPEIKIVSMQEAHLDTLAQLERSCFSVPWSYSSLKEELLKEESVFLVALDKKTIMGYIGMHKVCGEGYITNLAVFPNFRQKGVGRFLLRALIDNMGKNGLRFLSLEVRISNKIAIEFYESEGFLIVGQRKNFYSFPREDAVIMTKYN